MRIDGRIIFGGLVAGGLVAAWYLLIAGDGFMGGPWGEFIMAGWVVAVLLGAVRWAAGAQSVDQDLAATGRHQTVTVPQFDARLAATDEAVQAFVDAGDVDALHGLDDPDVVRRLRPLADAPRPRPMVLIAPWWSYGGALLAVAVFVITLAIRFAMATNVPADVVVPMAFTIGGLLVATRSLNRFGGPWWLATLCGWLGLALLVGGLMATPDLGRFLFGEAATITWSTIAGFALLFLLAWFGRHRMPRFATSKPDAAAIADLRSQDIRRIIQFIIIGAVILGLLLATLALPFWDRGFEAFLEFLAGTTPGLIIAAVLPATVRLIGLAIDGPRAIRRIEQRRHERAQRIIHLLGAP